MLQQRTGEILHVLHALNMFPDIKLFKAFDFRIVQDFRALQDASHRDKTFIRIRYLHPSPALETTISKAEKLIEHLLVEDGFHRAGNEIATPLFNLSPSQSRQADMTIFA